MALSPPKLFRNFEIILILIVQHEPLRAGAYQAAMSALADCHLRLVAAVKDCLKQTYRLCGRNPFFLAFHLFCAGKARPFNETNFNIAKETIEPLLENRAILDERCADDRLQIRWVG